MDTAGCNKVAGSVRGEGDLIHVFKRRSESPYVVCYKIRAAPVNSSGSEKCHLLTSVVTVADGSACGGR